MKNLIIIFFLQIFTLSLVGQQEIILSQYNKNLLLFNPASSGIAGEGQGDIDLTYRNQWNSIEGAPKTILLVVDKNLYDTKVGLGLNISKESIGINSRTDIMTNYSYRLPFERSDLFLGLRAGITFINSDFSKIKNSENQDPVYESATSKFNIWSVGLGAMYKAEHYYLGLSVPAVASISTKHDNYKERHYYLHGGGLIGPDYIELKVEPTFLLKYQPASPLQYTLGLNLWLSEIFAIETRYRSSESVGLGITYLYADQFEIGALYDLGVGSLTSDRNANSFEIMLGYRFSGNELPMAFSRNYRLQEN